MLLIGDVSGKGLGAALLMSNVQARVHVLFEDPEAVADRTGKLNRSVAADCPGNCFITLFAAVLDPATGDLLYCNAGHNPPLLIHADDTVEPLGATGLPLGISPNARYEQGGCRMTTGDVLVLFSDGITEACIPEANEEFGEQRLIAFIQAKRRQPAAELIEGIKEELLSFTSGAPAADDITLVIARRV
jgi:serine phosphatase RsbU (regulator of sigma subunit)